MAPVVRVTRHLEIVPMPGPACKVHAPQPLVLLGAKTCQVLAPTRVPIAREACRAAETSVHGLAVKGNAWCILEELTRAGRGGSCWSVEDQETTRRGDWHNYCYKGYRCKERLGLRGPRWGSQAGAQPWALLVAFWRYSVRGTEYVCIGTCAST
jgi:hypothetical protein